MKKALPLFLLLCACLMMVACKTAGVSGQPTAPDLNTPYQKAATAMSAFASDVASAQQITINLRKGGVIDKPTSVAIQTQFKNIAVYGKQIDALILAQASATTIQAKVNAALGSLSSIATSTVQIDPSALLQIQVSIQALQQVLGTVLTAFNLTTSEVIHGSTYDRSLSGAGCIAHLADLQPSEGLADSRRNDAAFVGSDRRGRREVRSDLAGSGRRNSSPVVLAA